MKVIFLDIDGVLNSDEYVDRVKKSDIQGIERDIDIEKVKLLKRAIDETGASSGKISVSASNGRIYCDEPFRVINLAGQDVTSLNGNLQGTYIVVSGDKAVKVVVD